MSSRSRLRGLALLAATLVLPASSCEEDVGEGDQFARHTVRVSVRPQDVESSGGAGSPSISGDGRYVAFQSDASDLLAADINGKADIYVKDRATGAVECVSLFSQFGAMSDGDSSLPSISADGRRVAFQSDADLSGFLKSNPAIFVRDRLTGDIVFVMDDTVDPNAALILPSLSANGRYVAFRTAATNIPGFTNPSGTLQVFVSDLSTAPPTLMLASRSTNAAGTEGCNGNSFDPKMVGNGPAVVFSSSGTNLPNADGSAASDVFLAVPGAVPASTTVELVSLTDADAPVGGNCGSPSASADGRYVIFETTAPALNPARIALRDRTLGTTVSVYDEPYLGGLVLSKTPRISPDGRFLTFMNGSAPGLTPSSNLQVIVRTLPAGPFEFGSVNTQGALAAASSTQGTFSADGRWLTFFSFASNLVTGDLNGTGDVFVRGPFR